MKIDPVVKIENNNLVDLEGNNIAFELVEIFDINSAIPTENKFIYRLNINQGQVETEPESYNEEFLAKLREYLKEMEENNQIAILNFIPGIKEGDAEKIAEGKSFEDKVLAYIDSIKHATRRVKDCISLIGLEINQKFIESDASNKIEVLIDELIKKHSHYIYFIKSSDNSSSLEINSEYDEKIYRY